MTKPSTSAYRFGDLLALVRAYWVREMTRHLADVGYPDYLRSDALLMRLLARGPTSITQLGTALGVTRQAARKFVTSLERRGYAKTARDEHDARQTNVLLTKRGVDYAHAVQRVIRTLDRNVADRVDPDALAAADAVLRAALPNEAARELADRLIPPPR
jgi:DNA-binding MarR family transcriptional regulator